MSDHEEPPSRFIDQYKNYGRTESALQEERRLRLLEKQKQSRHEELDAGRPGLLEEVDDTPQQQRGAKKRPKFVVSKLFANKVQLSEWMHEKPTDLENWFVVPCPVGQRCLLVIRNGLAVAYNKRGRSIASINTRLDHMRGTIVLDCILSKTRVFYTLDALAFLQVDLVNCECQFRFAWIASQFHEKYLAEKFSVKTMKDNRGFQLSLLPVYDLARPESMESCWSRFPAFTDDNPRLDGYLFYHKESHYVYGQTPLVTWLFPFMLNDVLKLPPGLVNEQYLLAKPISYTGDYAAYIKEFDRLQQLRKRRPRGRKGNGLLMDTTNDDSVPDATLWEAMETAPLDSDDEDLRPREEDAMRELEMEGC
ncbi:snurportin-1 [Anopheles ziemanni]|uniref:snurportin-1 n=1 Tax=Anopheles coustani TaxID=139045 RepID=UPI0026591303|nr:snurportin-1 [Anopheles coustani]XP_058166195.1 snurportin-1 [Anopheles ziemanni]